MRGGRAACGMTAAAAAAPQLQTPPECLVLPASVVARPHRTAGGSRQASQAWRRHPMWLAGGHPGAGGRPALHAAVPLTGGAALASPSGSVLCGDICWSRRWVSNAGTDSGGRTRTTLHTRPNSALGSGGQALKGVSVTYVGVTPVAWHPILRIVQMRQVRRGIQAALHKFQLGVAGYPCSSACIPAQLFFRPLPATLQLLLPAGRHRLVPRAAAAPHSRRCTAARPSRLPSPSPARAPPRCSLVLVDCRSVPSTPAPACAGAPGRQCFDGHAGWSGMLVRCGLGQAAAGAVWQ